MTITSPWSAELAQDWVLDEWQPARWAVPWEQLADAVFDVVAWMEENGYERAGERDGIVYFEKRRPKRQPSMTRPPEDGKCLDCQGITLPPSRVNEGHVAVRFRDEFKYRVWMDGVDVSDSVTEAFAGADGAGWIVEMDKKQVCACRASIVQRLRAGTVVVVSA